MNYCILGRGHPHKTVFGTWLVCVVVQPFICGSEGRGYRRRICHGVRDARNQGLSLYGTVLAEQLRSCATIKGKDQALVLSHHTISLLFVHVRDCLGLKNGSEMFEGSEKRSKQNRK